MDPDNNRDDWMDDDLARIRGGKIIEADTAGDMFTNLKLTPNYNITIQKDGHKCVIDWNSGVVKISGTLPLEPAAYQFFQAVGENFLAEKNKLKSYRSMLERCALQFKAYAEHHRDNNTHEDREKAEVNERLVALISWTLDKDF